MPIDARKSVADIIKELMQSYKETGKIGNQAPENADKAREVAIAIALETKR